MKPFNTFLLLLSLLLTSCGASTPAAAPQIVTVYATPAAQPWLAELYDCAAETPLIPSLLPAAQSADIVLRLGEPENLAAPAYRIGAEQIVIIVHPQNPLAQLSAAELRALFSGQTRSWSELGGADAALQVWVYAAGEDVQQIFEAAVMGWQPLTTLARLAPAPDVMRQAVAADVAAIGILPRRWATGDVRVVYEGAPVPVLAITAGEPQGAEAELLACLQK